MSAVTSRFLSAPSWRVWAAGGLALLGLLAAAAPARAQSEASAHASSLPVASVLTPSAMAGASVTLVGALPVALSAGGATLVVKSVQASGAGLVLTIERVSDAAQASLEVAQEVMHGVDLVVGTALSVTVLASGAIISKGAEALMFVPNAVGQRLLHNQVLG